jgi:DNA mismatch endonuclease (patch repair protein)
MADVISKAKRSQVMASVRSSGNRSTELKLAALFRLHRVTGWRRNARLPGKPDFVFRRHKLAVFVDGCFWHGCPMHCRMPKSRRSFWLPKIHRNVLRDRRVRRLLARRGWSVIRIWEHSLHKPAQVLARIQVALVRKHRKE